MLLKNRFTQRMTFTFQIAGLVAILMWSPNISAGQSGLRTICTNIPAVTVPKAQDKQRLLPLKTPKEIEVALFRPIRVTFKQIPFHRLIRALALKSGLRISLLASAEAMSEIPVTIDLQNTSLANTLRMAAVPRKLTYFVASGQIFVAAIDDPSVVRTRVHRVPYHVDPDQMGPIWQIHRIETRVFREDDPWLWSHYNKAVPRCPHMQEAEAVVEEILALEPSDDFWIASFSHGLIIVRSTDEINQKISVALRDRFAWPSAADRKRIFWPQRARVQYDSYRDVDNRMKSRTMNCGFNDQPLHEIAAHFARRSGIRIAVDEDVRDLPTTYHAEEMTFQPALWGLLDQHDLVYQFTTTDDSPAAITGIRIFRRPSQNP